jgi:hypothetical protein
MRISLKSSLSTLLSLASFAAVTAEPAAAYPYWKSCDARSQLQDLPLTSTDLDAAIRKATANATEETVAKLQAHKSSCFAELEARLAYLGTSDTDAQIVLFAAERSAETVAETFLATTSASPAREAAKLSFSIQACQNAAENLPAKNVVVDNRLLVYYPFHNQLSYISGYRKGNVGDLHFRPASLPAVENMMKQALIIGVDPYAAYAIGANEIGTEFHSPDRGVHPFHMTDVLACGKRALREVPGTNDTNALVFSDDDLGSRFVRALGLPISAGQKTYLCAGTRGRATRLMDLSKGSLPREIPSSGAQCCLELPLAYSSIPESQRESYGLYKRLFALEYIRMHIASIPKIANESQRAWAQAEVLDRFLNPSHGIVGSGAGFMIATSRLGVNSRLDPIYGFQAMDFVSQSFSVNPWLKETRARLESELGVVAPHVLCAGAPASTVRIDSSEHYSRVHDAERMRFIKDAYQAKKDPFAVANSRWSVFFYELNKSQAVRTRLEKLMGWDEFHGALYDLEMWIIPWVKQFLATDAQREIYLKNYFSPGIQEAEAEDHERIRESIAKLLKAYVESGLYEERNTFGKASKMDSVYLWQPLSKVQARTLGRYARTRAKKATYEPGAPFYSGIEERDVRPGETTIGSPGQPVLFRLNDETKDEAMVAGFIRGVSPSGKPVISFNQEGVTSFHELDPASTSYTLKKLQRYTRGNSDRYYLPKESRYVERSKMYVDPDSSDRIVLEDGTRSLMDFVEISPIPSSSPWKAEDRVCFADGGFSSEWALVDALATGYAVVRNVENDTLDSRSWLELAPCVSSMATAGTSPVDSSHAETRSRKPRKRVRKSQEKWAFSANTDTTEAIGNVRGMSKRGEVVYTREKRRKAHRSEYRSLPQSQVVVFTKPKSSKTVNEPTFLVWSVDTLKIIGSWKSDDEVRKSRPVGVFMGMLSDGRWVIERNGRPEAFVPDLLVKMKKVRVDPKWGVARSNVSAQSATGEFLPAAKLGTTDHGQVIVYFIKARRIAILDPSQVR